MIDETETLTHGIGQRVKQERRSRTWTLDQLAESSGVSRRMLASIEKGSANPSIGTLLRLSDALGIGLPGLVESATSNSARVTRRGTGAVLWTGEGGGRGVLVAGTKPPDVVELWDWTLGPEDQHFSEPHSPGTKELLQVHEGSLAVSAGEQRFVLEPGDALTFLGDVAHSYRNNSRYPAHFSLTVFEPGVRPGHRTEITHD